MSDSVAARLENPDFMKAFNGLSEKFSTEQIVSGGCSESRRRGILSLRLLCSGAGLAAISRTGVMTTEARAAVEENCLEGFIEE